MRPEPDEPSFGDRPAVVISFGDRPAVVISFGVGLTLLVFIATWLGSVARVRLVRGLQPGTGEQVSRSQLGDGSLASGSSHR